MANDMDPNQLDLEDLPPKALRKLIRQMLAKGCRVQQSDKDTDKVDDDRQERSDMHAARKGKPPEIPVSEEDFPFETDEDESDDDDSEIEEEESGDEDDEESEKKLPPNFKKRSK
jgi:hypothetical protein